jgi:5-formyltetrahydrofolate cyclo-ligase|tara:strand:+ start:950 stop:1498 length:549 start_codon:yes stop_codon:yes gene_type:complete
MASKEKLRKKFVLLRKKKYFSVEKKFFKPLIELISKKNKKKISLYYPSNYEVDTKKLFEILKSRKILQTSLPIVSSNGEMFFSKWSLNEPLKVNRYGFLEPVIYKRIRNPNVILIPLLAYDRFRNRLGYGKGYYDRFLRDQLIKNKNILTIGLAFSFQKYKKIPTSKFDMRLDYILTEKGIL